MSEQHSKHLPVNDTQRLLLHNEIHTRPSATFKLPALVVYVAVLNANVSTTEEFEHLQRLPQTQPVEFDKMKGNFLQIECNGYKVIWERHSEFTRYTIVQPLPPHAQWGSDLPELGEYAATGSDWLKSIPGKTITAIHLGILNEGMDDPDAFYKGKRWLGNGTLIGSKMGRSADNASHSQLMTNLKIGEDGFERLLVLAVSETSENRAGRIAQRLLELETYRIMALLSLPIAKQLSVKLRDTEVKLVEITNRLEKQDDSDEILMNELATLAAQVESITAEHSYRFSAALAYDAIVRERIAEMREQPLSGMQTVGEFMQRRLAPAIATVKATSVRLSALAERIARASALLRTRVEIAAEAHNRQLLEKLTRGQELQLRLQATVEGLSIAAITYYVVSLVLFIGKAMKAYGLNINPELLAGFCTPVVLFFSWRTIQHIHLRLKDT
ncbi:MAG: DUF3422 family protein [Limnohabitans sp.]